MRTCDKIAEAKREIKSATSKFLEWVNAKYQDTEDQYEEVNYAFIHEILGKMIDHRWSNISALNQFAEEMRDGIDIGLEDNTSVYILTDADFVEEFVNSHPAFKQWIKFNQDTNAAEFIFKDRDDYLAFEALLDLCKVNN